MARPGRWWLGWCVLVVACGAAPPGADEAVGTGPGEEVQPGAGCTGLLCIPSLAADVPVVRRADTLPPLQEAVPTYTLRLPAATLAAFHADPYLPEQPAVFVTPEGQELAVRVRVRGGSSRHYPKKSWRVELPEGTHYEGRRKLNLVAEMADRTLMVEKLGFDLLRAIGGHAPRAKFVRLVINGRAEGVFLDLERVDKAFTRARGWADADPTIYRCGSQDCELKPLGVRYAWQADWEKETNEAEPRDDLRALLDVVNTTPEPDFVRVLARHLEVEDYLRAMVADTLISNDIVMDSGSYLVRDRTTGRWTYVPWDYNNAVARWWPTYGLGARPRVDRPPLVFSLYDARVQFFYEQRKATAPDYRPAFSNLTHRVAANRLLRARYGALLEGALARVFTPEVLHPRIDAMHALLRPHVEQDPYVRLDTEGRADPDGLAKFLEARQYLRDYVTGRAAFLRRELPALAAPPRRGLVIAALDARGGWLALRNDGASAASTAGLVLTTDLRRAVGVRANVPAATLAPGQTLRLTAGQLGLTLPRAGAVGLFDGRSVVGPHDALFYGPLERGHYARDAAQPDDWRVAQ